MTLQTKVREAKKIKPGKVKQILLAYEARSSGVIFGAWFEPPSSLNGPEEKRRIRKMSCHFGEIPSDLLSVRDNTPADPEREPPEMIYVYEVANMTTMEYRVRQRAAKRIGELQSTLAQHLENGKEFQNPQKIQRLQREINRQMRLKASPTSAARTLLATPIGININGVRRLTMELQVYEVEIEEDKPQPDPDADLPGNAGALG